MAAEQGERGARWLRARQYPAHTAGGFTVNGPRTMAIWRRQIARVWTPRARGMLKVTRTLAAREATVMCWRG